MAGPTRVFKNPHALADHFLRLEAEADEKLWVMADMVMNGAVEAIKEVYGDELRLAPLKEATIIEKERKGAADPYAPLILTGELRESTYGEMIESGGGNVAVAVGSDDPKAKWHETGVPKHNLPSRPVHWIGANDILPFIAVAVRLFGSAMATGDTSLALLRRLRLRRL
jgi:hypothetical protein